jgi:hypothetical protein
MVRLRRRKKLLRATVKLRRLKKLPQATAPRHPVMVNNVEGKNVAK